MRPGELFAERFVIRRLAGSGGMGTVYLAEDLRTGAPVALKVLLGTPLHAEDLRFEREARAIAEIDHPGVVRHVAHGQTAAGRRYLAMEWIEGEDLAVRLQRGPLSVAETMAVGLRVAEALGAAHAQRVVHRDLKPSNILLADHALDQAKIVDFGLATFPAADRATLSGMVLGTPAYMAPEQARALRDLDARADVFALGAVLHECLTGKPAFDGSHVMAVLARIVFEEVPRLRDLGRDVPAALDALIARMLAKDPAARPADGGDVALSLAALREAVAHASGAPVTASAERSRLTPAEQRLLAIVLAKAPRTGADPVGETIAASDTYVARSLEDAVAAVEARGARADVLADGTLAVTVRGTGLATDQAALAAGCALVLRRALPGWAVVVATGRAELAAERLVGGAIDRAARRLRERQRASGASETIDLDDVSAGLLDLRFDVVVGPLGLELRGEHDVAEAARTLLGRPTAFVGRDHELGTLEALFADCVDQPCARAALVTAPAGMGKSRLRHELTERLRARGGVEVWIARGDPMRAGAPLGLLAALVHRVARLHDGEPPEARRRKLLARVSRHVAAPDRLRVAEFLGELVGTPFPDEGRVQLRAARQDPRLLGDQMRRAWVDLLDAEMTVAPLVLVLEDMHWGDKPSAEYVDAALRLLDDRPLFCLALARPDVHERLPELWHKRAVLQIGLRELPRRACQRLARDVLGDGASPEVVAQLSERSEGNPFFLEELLRAAAEGRVEALPETMLAVVESRLERLDAEDRRLLRAASVFGGMFWRGGVAALLGSGERLDARLARLEEGEWLVRRPDAKFDGEVEYGFRHALVREAAYGTLAAEDRALGHRLAGAWLEAAGEADALVLAEHYERGGETEDAARCYCAASEHALERNDLSSVVARVDRAVALGATGEALGRAALARAIAHNWRGDRTGAGTWARRAAWELAEGSARWCAAMAEMVWAEGARGDGASVGELGDALVASMTRADAPSAHVIALLHTVTVLLTNGRYEKARAVQAAVAPVVERLRDEPAVEAVWLVVGAWFAAYEDDPYALREHIEEAVARFEAAGDQRQACLHRATVAEACVRLGAHAEAEGVARSVLAEAERLGLTHAVVAAQSILGNALALQGKLDDAQRTFREVTAIAITDPYVEGLARSYLADMLRVSGDLEAAEGESCCAAGLLAAFPMFLPIATAVLADVLLAQRRSAAALEHAQRAFDLLASLGHVEEGDARIRVVYADALLANDRPEAARAAVADARDRLLARAARIGDEARRRSFLENVPENARTLALARRLVDEPA